MLSISEIELLFVPQVQKELGLSDEQKEKLCQDCSGPLTTAPTDWQQRLDRVGEILKPEQLHRLLELSVQSYGARF